MGSFLTKCIASQQTISGGSSCFIFPIKQQHGYQPVELVNRQGEKLRGEQAGMQICYPDSFWKPEGLLISAKYEDYGRFEIDKTAENCKCILELVQLLMSSAYKVIPEEGANKNGFDIHQYVQAHMPQVSADIKNIEALPLSEALWDELMQFWDYLWESVDEQQVFVDQHRPSVLRFAALHASSVSYLIEIAEQRKWGSDAMDQRSRWNRFIEKFKTDPAAKERAHSWVYMGLPDSIRCPGNIHYTDHSRIFEACAAMLKPEPDFDAIFLKLKPSLDLRSVMTAMYELELKVSPLVYDNQDYQNRIGSQYAKFVRNVCKDILIAQRKEDS